MSINAYFFLFLHSFLSLYVHETLKREKTTREIREEEETREEGDERIGGGGGGRGYIPKMVAKYYH